MPAAAGSMSTRNRWSPACGCKKADGANGGPVFGTTTAEILRLHAGCSAGCTHVAMESTGVYWQPVFNLLESSFRRRAGQCAAHQGRARSEDRRRRTASGWPTARARLIRGELHSTAAVRDLRDLTRHRKSLIRDRVKATNRVHKLLETANIKLGEHRRGRLGVSGRAMLNALVAGETDPTRLATLAEAASHPKVKQLAETLRGQFTPHHAFLLEQILDATGPAGGAVASAIRESPTSASRSTLSSSAYRLVGVGRRSAEVIVGDRRRHVAIRVGRAHVASWARICPGTHESAGKRRKRGHGHGKWLRTTLLESAWAASHSRESYLGAQYRRISKRRGPKRPAIAVAHSILVIAYHILRRRRGIPGSRTPTTSIG